MLDHIGDEYEGVISGVTAHGIYVELPDTVEGMVRLSDIPDDFYVFNEVLMEVRGKNSGRAFRMGDPVRVKVLAADKDMRTIDFGIAAEETVKEKKEKSAKKVKKNAVEKKRRKKTDSK